jgi:hypothetical protein
MLAALRTDESKFRRALGEQVVQAVLACPLGELVDPDELVGHVAEVVADAPWEGIMDDVVTPGLDRLRQSWREADESLEEALPTSVRESIEELLSGSRGPRFGWLTGAVDRQLVGDFFAPIFRDLLSKFARKLTQSPTQSPGGGAPRESPDLPLASLAGRLSRRVTRGAGALVDVGRQVLPGLSAEIENRVQEVIDDFASNAAQEVRQAVAERVASAEGQKILMEMRLQTYRRVLETAGVDIIDDLDRIPLSKVLALFPPVLSHNLSRPVVLEFVTQELRRALERDGARPLADWLDEHDLLESTRQSGQERVDVVLRRLVDQPAFAEWLEELAAQ